MTHEELDQIRFSLEKMDTPQMLLDRETVRKMLLEIERQRALISWSEDKVSCVARRLRQK